MTAAQPAGQFVRIAEQDRPRVRLTADGAPLEALAGDTVLTALLLAGRRVRTAEFGGGERAGFCLMGACQDCWVTIDGRRARACTTPAAEGMAVATR